MRIWRNQNLIKISLGICTILCAYTNFFSIESLPTASAIVCSNCEQEASAIARHAELIALQSSQAANTAATAIATAASFDSFFTKEFLLDTILYGLVDVALQSITQSIITWINSGFQGSPAFVTDLKQSLTDLADATAGELIKELGGEFLCSPFRLDVQVAIATMYQNRRAGKPASCTLTGVIDNIENFVAGVEGSFATNGWPAWFEITQSQTGSALSAGFEAQAGVSIALIDAQGRMIEELSWGKGFLSFKGCKEIQTDKGPKEQCTTNTPGAVIQDAASEYLYVGTKRLIVADEIDEIVGALLAQLAKQALIGAAGMLGLGGSSSSNNSFGESGTASYLEALTEPTDVQPLRAFETQINNARATLVAYQGTQITILDAGRTLLNRAIEAEGNDDLRFGCFNYQISGNLLNVFDEASENLERIDALEELLDEIETRYQAATSRTEQAEIYNVFQELERRGDIKTDIDVLQEEFFIDYELSRLLDAAYSDINNEINRCQE